MGIGVDPRQYIKEFDFDSGSDHAEKRVQFGELSVWVHRDGTRILMKVASSKNESLVSVSEKESEIYLQLNEEAVAICLQ